MKPQIDMRFSYLMLGVTCGSQIMVAAHKGSLQPVVVALLVVQIAIVAYCEVRNARNRP